MVINHLLKLEISAIVERDAELQIAPWIPHTPTWGWAGRSGVLRQASKPTTAAWTATVFPEQALAGEHAEERQQCRGQLPNMLARLARFKPRVVSFGLR